MAPQQTLSPRAWTDLVLLSLLWGGSFMAFRVMLDELGVVTTAMHRVLWAALLLWAWALVRGYRPPRSWRIWGAFLVMGLLNNAIPFTLIAWGQLTVETGLAAIYNASTAIFGILVAAAVFADERMTARKTLGTALGFAGCVWAIGPENLTRFDPRSVAQLAILAASLSYAFAGAWARAHLSALPTPVAAAGMLTGSSLILVPLAILTEGPPALALAPATWGGILYASVFATALAYLLYYRILAVAGSGNLLLVTLLIAPVAIVVGAVMRDEVLPVSAYVGFAILALGLIVIDGRVFSRLNGKIV